MFRILAAVILAAFALAAQAAVDVNQASQTSQAEFETVKGIGPGCRARSSAHARPVRSRTGPTWSIASAASGPATRPSSRKPA